MPEEKTPRGFAAEEINQTRRDINKPRDLCADQLIAACTARAHLAVAAALLDVADAIRGDGGASAERAMERMTEALREATGRRET